MPWRGPSYEGEFPSLGWALVDLIENYYRVPSGAAFGQSFKLTNRQVSRIVRAHRIDPKTGRYFYRRVVKEGPKGEGKSPEAGGLAFAHMVGPVVFDGWDAAGEPVGRPHPTPWIQLAALSLDQTDNTYAQLHAGLADSPAIDDFGLDLGLTRIYFRDGKKPGRIEPVSSAGGSREGQPVTFVVKEETQYWTPNRGGDRLNATLDRNLAKTGGLSYAVTNAFRKGESSVAEKDAEAAAKGAKGLLYECVRGPVVEDLTDRRAVVDGLRAAYDPQSLTENGGWVDVERIADECADPGVRPQDARRFYFNIPDEANDDSWVEREVWEAGADASVVIPDGAEVFCGVDVALYRDNTAVAVVWPSDGKFVVQAKTWDPKETGEVDVTDVMAYIRDLSFRFKLREVVFDPRFFDVPAKMLEADGVPMVELPQTSTFMVPACGFAYEQIRSGNVVHDGDPTLTAHVLAAAQRPGESGWTLSKNRSKHVIDACIAMVMAMYRAGQPQEAQRTWFGGWE